MNETSTTDGVMAFMSASLNNNHTSNNLDDNPFSLNTWVIVAFMFAYPVAIIAAVIACKVKSCDPLDTGEWWCCFKRNANNAQQTSLSSDGRPNNNIFFTRHDLQRRSIELQNFSGDNKNESRKKSVL